MVNVTEHAPETGHRAGRMLEGMLASKNKGAKVLLTTDITGADGESRYHQTFALKRWEAGDGAVMVSVTVHGSGDWASGIRPISVMQLDMSRKRVTQSRDRRADDRLLIYAAEAAVAYAWFGEAGTPTPKNGSVAVVEESTCGACGRELTDPVSVARGIGPECFGKATGTTTIRGRKRAQPSDGQEALA